MPLATPEDIFAVKFREEFMRYFRDFRSGMEDFIKIRRRLIELLDDAIADGKIQVRTAKEVAILIEAYAKLAETENRLVASLAQLTKIINERDALTVALISASTSSNPRKTDQLPNYPLVPVFELPDGVSDHESFNGNSEAFGNERSEAEQL